jgi:plasmid stability protein
MANVTVKNLPQEVHRRLKARAARHGRSLNAEMVTCLRAAVSVETIDVEALVHRARMHRASIATTMDDRAVRVAKKAGRA